MSSISNIRENYLADFYGKKVTPNASSEELAISSSDSKVNAIAVDSLLRRESTSMGSDESPCGEYVADFSSFSFTLVIPFAFSMDLPDFFFEGYTCGLFEHRTIVGVETTPIQKNLRDSLTALLLSQIDENKSKIKVPFTQLFTVCSDEISLYPNVPKIDENRLNFLARHAVATLEDLIFFKDLLTTWQKGIKILEEDPGQRKFIIDRGIVSTLFAINIRSVESYPVHLFPLVKFLHPIIETFETCFRMIHTKKEIEWNKSFRDLMDEALDHSKSQLNNLFSKIVVYLLTQKIIEVRDIFDYLLDRADMWQNNPLIFFNVVSSLLLDNYISLDQLKGLQEDLSGLMEKKSHKFTEFFRYALRTLEAEKASEK